VLRPTLIQIMLRGSKVELPIAPESV